ncbi:MAG: FkbM family methyltransferase, partial [Burkholderiales bacterium]|nr:FkbM family methyltransferase [Burkholderiales bacterium]
MSFISYAQNYEDVMLWRALKHVQNGFYIDVGANDPVVDSVTKSFYDIGWRGINIEPLASHHQDLTAARPEDINLRYAAGSKRGKTKIWECDVRGWATASRQVIKKYEQDGHKGVFHSVSLVRLADICEQYVTNDIHFLKIDVEGLEEDVLKGMDFKKFRPWIVLIEATIPNSTEEIHQSWEELILSEDYVFAYADGLNRFYVSKEQASKLVDVLRYPPNVFDGYIRVQQLEAELRAQRSETELHNAVEMGQASKVQALDLSVQLEQAQEHERQAKVQVHQALEVAQGAQAQVQALSVQLEQAKGQAQEQEHQAKAQVQQALAVAESAQAQAQELSVQLEQTKEQAQEQEHQAKAQVQQALAVA